MEKLGFLKADSKSVSGTFNFGASEPIAANIVPPLLKNLHRKYPLINANVYTSTARQLLEMISDRKLEFGLLFHIPGLLENLEVHKRIPYRFRVVINSSMKKDKSVIQSFIGSREIDDNSSYKFPTVDLMRKRYPDTRIVLSSNHLGLHRELVLLGAGVSILPLVNWKLLSMTFEPKTNLSRMN